MKARLLFFATLKDRFGTGEREMVFETAPTAGQVFAGLFENRAEAERWTALVRFAVNCEYVEPGTRLADGDELALIPPVSGG